MEGSGGKVGQHRTWERVWAPATRVFVVVRDGAGWSKGVSGEALKFSFLAAEKHLQPGGVGVGGCELEITLKSLGDLGNPRGTFQTWMYRS